jgi:hypothetical protein
MANLIEVFELRRELESVLLSARTTVSTSSLRMGGLFDVISSKISQQFGTGGWSKKRHYELVAMSRDSEEFVQLTSVLQLRSLVEVPTEIFRKIFFFNQLAFLDTDRIQKLCRMLHVSEGSYEYAVILHYAAMSYLIIGEVDGAISITERLVRDYQYPEVWRIVGQFAAAGVVLSHELLASAIKSCPVEELDNMMNAIKSNRGPRVVERKATPPKFNYIKAFPNLADDENVDEYVAQVGGDPVGVSYNNAKLLAKMDTLIGSDTGTVNLLEGIRKCMIQVV